VTQNAGAGAPLTANSLALSGNGAFLLDNAQNVVPNLGANVNGALQFRTSTSLTVSQITTTNNDATLYSGGAFRATGGSGFVIDTGTRNLLVVPNVNGAGGRVDVGLVRAANATYGNTTGTAGGQAFNNTGADSFNILVSPDVRNVVVFGNDPRQVPGDTLLPVSTDPRFRSIVLTESQPDPSGGRRGVFTITYQDGSFSRLQFFQIESFGNSGFQAAAIQTGPADYAVRAQFFVGGQPVGGAINGQGTPVNAFVVSPNIVNPTTPFAAPVIAFGDVDGDGTADLVIANGAGDTPLVRIINGRALQNSGGVDLSKLQPGQLLGQFFAYNPTFRGGVSIAVRAGGKDSNGKIIPGEVVTGPGPGGGPNVGVWRLVGNTPVQVASFDAYEAEFRGGVTVAAGDINNDGTADIVVGTGPGGGPRVRVFTGKQAFTGARDTILLDFFAYNEAFRGGVLVAAGDYDGNAGDEILTGPGFGGSPHIKVFGFVNGIFDPEKPLANFFAFTPEQPNGLQMLGGSNQTGVSSVAFGTPAGARTSDTGTDAAPTQRDILVGTSRGSRVQILRFSPNGTTNPTPRGDQFGNLSGDAPVLDPNGRVMTEAELFDGANVAGFSSPNP